MGGEIDIVASKDGEIVFLEVKDLKGVGRDYFLAEESVRSQKKRILIKTAKIYLSEKKYPPEQVWRIDVVGINFNSEKSCRLRHIKTAVTE